MRKGYHYEECGLDHVYLANGYREIDTPHGKAIAIADVEALHTALARTIVERQSPIRGQELRFLRKHLDYSQKALAALMGETEQDIFRWEKSRDKAIPGAADRLVRVIAGPCVDSSDVRPLLERLAELDRTDVGEIRLREHDGTWDRAA